MYANNLDMTSSASSKKEVLYKVDSEPDFRSKLDYNEEDRNYRNEIDEDFSQILKTDFFCKESFQQFPFNFDNEQDFYLNNEDNIFI